MSKKLYPLADRIIVKRVEQRRETESGLVIPDTVDDKPMEGEVLAVGPGKFVKGERVPLSLKVGDRVVFGKWAGTDLRVGEEEYLMLTEDDVIGILKE